MKYEKPDMEVVKFEFNTILTLASEEGSQGGGITLPEISDDDE